MPWDSTNKIITQDTAIGIGDVQRALSSGCIDLWTLCSHKSINKWAKYKPVQDNGKKADYSGLKFIDWKNDKSSGKAESYAKCPNYNPEWWKGYKGNCGLTLKKYTSCATMISKWGECWAYEPIRLGTDAARLTDFNGYYSDAVCPFHFIHTDGYMWSNEYQNYPSVTMKYNGIVNSGNLNISDITYKETSGVSFTNLSDMYFGLLIPYNSSGMMLYYVVTSNTKIGNMTYGDLPIGSEGQKHAFFLYSAQGYTSILKTGENTVYPVFCSEEHSDHAVEASPSQLIPMPSDPIVINVDTLLFSVSNEVRHLDTDGNVLNEITLDRNMTAFYNGFVRKFTITNSGSVNISCSVVVRTSARYALTDSYEEITLNEVIVSADTLGVINGNGTVKPYTLDAINLTDLYRNGNYPISIDTICIFSATAGDNLQQSNGYTSTNIKYRQ